MGAMRVSAMRATNSTMPHARAWCVCTAIPQVSTCLWATSSSAAVTPPLTAAAAAAAAAPIIGDCNHYPGVRSDCGCSRAIAAPSCMLVRFNWRSLSRTWTAL
jgi:hypothetical protein